MFTKNEKWFVVWNSKFSRGHTWYLKRKWRSSYHEVKNNLQYLRSRCKSLDVKQVSKTETETAFEGSATIRWQGYNLLKDVKIAVRQLIIDVSENPERTD